MKLRIKILIIIFIVLAIIFAFCAYSYMRIFSLVGQERKALHIDNGSIININGANLWTCVKGNKNNKAPILVIPGGPGFSSNYLEKHLQFLENHRQLIYFDPRSSGRSEYYKDLNNINFSTLQSDAIELIKTLAKNEHIDILAHSYGAATAYSILADNQIKVDNLILVSPVPPKQKKEFSDLFFRIGYPPKLESEKNKWFISNYQEVFGPMLANKQVIDLMKDVYANFSLMIKLESMDNYDYQKYLQNYDGKALFIFGDSNEAGLSSKSTQELLLKLKNDAKLAYISNSGHFSFAENKLEFQNLIYDFLHIN